MNYSGCTYSGELSSCGNMLTTTASMGKREECVRGVVKVFFFFFSL